MPPQSPEMQSRREPALPVGGDRYGATVCSIFMVNMVLGTGPMTLPYAFNQAGIVLGAIFLGVLMFLSFITTTFVVEALATANRVRDSKLPLRACPDSLCDSLDEDREIKERLEIGAIAEAVMPRKLSAMPYIVLCVYAYGVLTVYVISGVSSLAKEIGFVGGIDSYYIILVCFVLFVTPICFLDFQKTRPLQICIGAVRLIVVVMMMFFMVRWLIRQDKDVESRPIPLFNLDGIPDLFGNSAFIFMVHHSIPGLVFPLKDQRHAPRAVAGAFFTCYVVYLVLCLLALWAFDEETWTSCPNTPSHPCDIQTLFNMNFASVDENWAATFIVCYPILVISVFPLVAITLRNNLKALRGVTGNGIDFVNIRYTLLTVVPPFAVACFTRDVQSVMTYIGGYFGFALMLLIPSLLVLHGRKALPEGSAVGLPSPFIGKTSGKALVYTILVVFACAIIYETMSLATKHHR